MGHSHWPPSIAVAIVLCASLALAAPAPADTALRRDGTEAEKFVANPPPAGGIVLRRDGSRAQPYAPGTAPVREPGQGLGLGYTVLGLGILAVTAAVGLGATSRRRSAVRPPGRQAAAG
jgi:hypothetical protein